MPYSDRHKQQKAKNLTLLGIFLAIAAMLFVVTVLKIAGYM